MSLIGPRLENYLPFSCTSLSQFSIYNFFCRDDRKAEWEKSEKERQRRRNDRDTEVKNISLNRAFMDSTNPNYLDKSDIRSRLGKRQVISGEGYESKSTTKGLDPALYDEDKILDRDELERLRFANANTVRPWEVNPEIVPRGTYFEVSLIKFVGLS